MLSFITFLTWVIIIIFEACVFLCLSLNACGRFAHLRYVKRRRRLSAPCPLSLPPLSSSPLLHSSHPQIFRLLLLNTTLAQGPCSQWNVEASQWQMYESKEIGRPSRPASLATQSNSQFHTLPPRSSRYSQNVSAALDGCFSVPRRRRLTSFLEWFSSSRCRGRVTPSPASQKSP